jgi:hypothetical protein
MWHNPTFHRDMGTSFVEKAFEEGKDLEKRLTSIEGRLAAAEADIVILKNKVRRIIHFILHHGNPLTQFTNEEGE